MTVLITGASGGIGYELAVIFAKNGWNLILVARSADKLKELSRQLSQKFGVAADYFQMDLALPESALTLFDQIQRKSLTVNALVNNAGFGSFGLFAETDLLSESKLLELNIVTLTKLTKLFLKRMIAEKNGYILNIASTAAFQPGPLMAVYYASKAYVLSFSEAIADELSGTGVSVTAFCPGATVTGFKEAAGMRYSRMFKLRAMDAGEVALAAYHGMVDRKRVVIPGFLNKVLVFGSRCVPRSFAGRVARKIQEADR